MKATDIMTADVVSVGPDASVQKAAGMMAARRISGLPVVDQGGAVLGIVSESDLLHRIELGTGTPERRWSAVFQRSEDVARAFVKAHGTKVHEVMSRPVISVAPEADLGEVADVFDRYKIKRAPVVAGGKLRGMITRSDLVRALSLAQSRGDKPQRSSAEIHAAIVEALRGEPWLETSYVTVGVRDGRATVSGFVASAQQHEALRVLISEIPGVEAVDADQVQVGMPELGWDGLH